ncbi:MAG: helix-turn-helix domain-containing protein [Deltaproteobacteria bacterium]|nr:helix-turn-helix domain-containing protein [Deltaproteobacteria bacterium]
MKVNIIRTEADYSKALARMEKLWGSPSRTPKGEELELLMLVVEAYEQANYPVPPPDPIEAIRFRMDQQGIKATQLAETLDLTRARVSEILNKKRALTLDHVRRLSSFGVPANVLVREYDLTPTGAERGAKRPRSKAKTG